MSSMFSTALPNPASGAPSNPIRSRESTRSPSFCDGWSDYNLTWLFDPDRCDHLPLDQQLLLYKHNNLEAHKVYKVASGIWGGPRSRKRVIIASGMPGASSVTHHQTDLRPPQQQKSVVSQQAAQQDPEEDYRTWIAKRKQFRADLDGMGLNENWLQRKPNKTALEQRVLTRMIEARTKRRPPTPEPEEDPLLGVLADDSPVVRRPSPLAIGIIEKFLHKHNLRLIDLFRNVDKDKKWLVSRDEFRRAIRQAKIPISDVLLEDVVQTLDVDLNNQLDYRELAKGMTLWKVEKRQSKQHLVRSPEVTMSATKYGQTAGYELPPTNPQAKNCLKPKAKTSTKPKELGSTRAGRVSVAGSSNKNKPANRPPPRERTIHSASSTSSGRTLDPPDPDLRSEHYPTSRRTQPPPGRVTKTKTNKKSLRN